MERYGVGMSKFAPLDALLTQLAIQCKRYEHPPLQDCREADRLQLVRSGVRTKNLFLRDNYGRRHFLLVTPPDKQVDLKALSKQMQLSRLGFASAERLDKYLALKPGEVSLLALINDPECQVELWLDEAIWTGEPLQCHPLDNRHTWSVPAEGVRALLQHWQRELVVLAVPAKGD